MTTYAPLDNTAFLSLRRLIAKQPRSIENDLTISEIVNRAECELIDLRAEVAELRRQLGRSSRNSSQPPSADGPQVAPRRSRRGSGRRPGGARTS